MLPLVEVAPARPPRRPLASLIPCAVLCGAALSACSVFQPERVPAPVVVASPQSPQPTQPTVAPPDPAASAPPLDGIPVITIEPIDPATAGDRASRRLLAYHEQLRGLSPNELSTEIARLSALPASPAVSLELALALMQTRNGAELNRAIGLVDPLARGQAPEQRAWQPFARLLLSRLQDVRRLEDLLERRNQELRDSQRAVGQLNEKLEALKAIERSLAPGRTPVPAGVTGASSAAPASAAGPRKAP